MLQKCAFSDRVYDGQTCSDSAQRGVYLLRRGVDGRLTPFPSGQPISVPTPIWCQQRASPFWLMVALKPELIVRS